MKGGSVGGAAALASILYCVFSAMVAGQELPAVSAPNGKIEFDAGALSLPQPAFLKRFAGTLTLPLGKRFGLQIDITAANAPGFTASGAVHVFTRNPAAYLIGGTLGFVRSPGATVVAAGPEAELYLDRWTLEAWAGAAVARPMAPVAGPARVGPFAFASAHYYATDNWRLSLGVSWLDGYNALEAGSELLFDGPWAPLALTAAARLGEDGGVRATVGLRGYFGPDPRKSLIRRHREDDPTDRSTALYVAAGPKTLAGATVPTKRDGAETVDDPSSQEPPVVDDPSSEEPPEVLLPPVWCSGSPLLAWDGDTGTCLGPDGPVPPPSVEPSDGPPPPDPSPEEIWCWSNPMRQWDAESHQCILLSGEVVPYAP
ncbi:MAG TPA: hypothetical protein VHA07_14215 [Devosia sp.]|nr:hypothetical protein [Devosia sp.]